jgi:Asp-tRNA(Asn)/Glu-tRNA(Gln) amidotransferase A subunit family amidase
MAPTRRDVLAQLGALLALPGLRSVTAYATPDRDDPLAGTIAAYQSGRARGAFTAETVVQQALERADTHGRALHAIDQLDAATALDAARASDARRRRGTMRGLLDGVPVFAKSIHDVRGMPTSASSAEWAARFPHAATRDAIEVARLRVAGAVVLGKAAADDFAYRGNGTSSLTGQVRHPHDPDGGRTPGGSSAGAAVVVACHMAFGALGTDDGGSNRIPAQFSGVVGVKPTFGLVPRTGVIPTWPYLDTHGPLARSVADAALLLAVLVGTDGGDPWSIASSRAERDALASAASRDAAVLRGARLGVVPEHAPRMQMAAASVAVFDRALADCAAAGATLVEVTPSVTRENVQARFADAARARGDVPPDPKPAAPTVAALRDYFAGQGVALDPDAAVQRGLDAYRAYYDVIPAAWDAVRPMLTPVHPDADAAGRSFLRSRSTVVAELVAFLDAQRIDALVYPTMPFPAPLATDPWPDIRTPLGFGNWTGLPEVSVPSGHGSDGLPVGNLSFVGRPGTDATMLALAHAFEQVSRRRVAPPLPW